MVSLYRGSFPKKDEAELERWHESHKENIRCKNFIDKLVTEKYDGYTLPDECITETVKEFGYDRTMWVIANTIDAMKRDGRVSKENREWAKSIGIPKSDNNYFFRLKTDIGLVDIMARQLQEMYAQLGLFDSRHMIPDSVYSDYAGKLLIIRDTTLKEEYRTPENQLFFAQSGFGCDSTKIGRKVFGIFLSDGEETHFDRSDFIGIIADEYIPEWAKEKMEQITDQQNGGDSPAPKLGM